MRKVGIWLALCLLAQVMSVRAQDVAAVSSSTIYPGMLVDAGSVKLVDASYCPQCEPGFIRDIESVVGKIAVRTIIPGKLIFPRDLRGAPTVVRGREVSVVFAHGPLYISMIGIPLADALAGETVAIRNPKNGTIVHGVVGRDGIVRVKQ